MSANKHLIALTISAAVAVGQNAVAQEPGGDSAYQWGRWAVLSPAAGGEPFRAPDAPGSDFNARPSDADAFQPRVQSVEAPPVINDPGDRPRPTPPSVNDPGNRPRPSPPPISDPSNRPRPSPPS